MEPGNEREAPVEEFRGTERFAIRERLGSGGMGAVYRVYDRAREMEVALKVLWRMDAAAILRFKREFRALADVAHRNLVSLYELLYADPHWFFTMELVRGVPFRTYALEPPAQPPPREPIPGPTMDRQGGNAGDAELDPLAATWGETREEDARFPALTWEVPRPAQPAMVVTDFVRLRRGAMQLAEGVIALHQNGYLHCDIKPSNILVTSEPGPSPSEDERVVLLDFGLVTAAHPHRQPHYEISGTPGYMSPEQALGAKLTEATDWFSVGVMLYRLFTGLWPRPAMWLRDYLARGTWPMPPEPAELRSEVPADLSALCMDLLQGDPAARPPGLEVLRRLGGGHSTHRPGRARVQQSLPPDGDLIGRAEQIDALREALAAVDQGAGEVVYVCGAPGMGKTALVEHFLGMVAEDPLAVIVRGRCYQQESVPYKALDNLIDSLCHYLTSVRSQGIDTLLPPDMAALVRVFPVLSRVMQLAGRDAGEKEAEFRGDPQELRRRAFAALRELLTRIGTRRRLIVFIDDLQWGDIDSAPGLEMLMRPPATPRMLLVLAYRAEDRERSPLLRMLLGNRWMGHEAPTRSIEVGHLSMEDAAKLAQMLFRGAGEPRTTARMIARESGGDPLFIHELVQHALVSSLSDSGGALSLAEVVLGRVADLRPDERRLVELLAVAGRPLPIAIACKASGLDSAEQHAVLHRLRAARLLRIAEGSAHGEQVAFYHDRIREILVKSLPEDERRRVSRSLASTIEASASPDAEALANYYLAAGDQGAAARYALVAAQRAASAFSFGRAAELYQQALTLGEHDRDGRRTLLIALAEMQQAAGRGHAAASAFLAAASLSEGLAVMDLLRRAAGEELRSGQIAKGQAIIAPVLAEVGLTLPETRAGAIAQLLYWRGRLRLQGLYFAPRQASAIPARERLRMTTCLEMGTGLSNADPVTASAFTSRALVEALALGDRENARAACTTEIALVAALGKLDRGAELAALLERIADPNQIRDRVNIIFASAMLLLFSGRFAEAYRRGQQTLELIRSSPERMDQYSLLWLRDVTAQYSVLSLLLQLDLAEMARVVPEYITEATRSGNRQASAILRALALPIMCVNAGELDRAHREAQAAIAEWGTGDFQLLHFIANLSRIRIDVHKGDGIRAWQRCQEIEPALQRSLLLQVQLVRVQWRYFRSMAALWAVACGAKGREALLGMAERDAHKLDSEDMSLPRCLARLLRANIALLSGSIESARSMLHNAASAFDRINLPNWAARIRWGLGSLAGGPEGAVLMETSKRALIDHGTAHLPAMTRTLLVSAKP